MTPSLYLGASRPLASGRPPAAFHLPAHHLVTHGVVMGMTGSGKTGLVTVFVEEALRARVPVLVVDVKGDLPNLLLSFPSFGSEAFLPWVGNDALAGPGATRAALAQHLATQRQMGLAALACSSPHRTRWTSTTARSATPACGASDGYRPMRTVV